MLARFSVTIDDSAAAPPTPVATGTIAGKVTESDGTEAISGASVVVEGTSLSTTTAADGTYSIADVPTGDRSVTASASGFESQTKPATVNEDQTTTVDFAPAAQTTATTFSLSVSYVTEGGKNSDKHLLVTFTADDGGGNPVSGVTFSHTLNNSNGGSWGPVTGTTGADGKVTFTLKNAPKGTYSVTVHSASDDTLTWDKAQPTDTLDKQ